MRKRQAPQPLIDAPRSSTLRAAWPGMLLALALLLPFLHKAFAVDDVTFLLEARHILQDPVHPTAFEMVADGQRIRVSEALVSGPVAAYLLVPAMLLGGAEWPAHVVMLSLLLLAVYSTTALARRLGWTEPQARFAGLLLAATPVVLAMASTNMADVPAMAFGVTGLERLLAWRSEPRARHAVLAALALALATLSRSHAALLLPVGALAMWQAPHTGRPDHPAWRAWVPLVAAALLIVVVNAITADPAHTRGDLIQTTLLRFKVSQWVRKSAAFASYWVLVIPLALPWLLVRASAMLRDPLVVLSGLLSAGGFLTMAPPALPLPLVIIATLGVMVLADLVIDGVRRRDGVQGWLVAWLFLGLAAVGYVHLPPKYLVPSAPAAALLVSRLLGPVPMPARRLAPSLAGITVALGALLGLMIVLADADFTAVGRRVAREHIAPRVQAGERVWYSGRWGAQWYAERAGARTLARTAPFPAHGDLVVTSRYAGGLSLEHDPAFESIATVHAASRYGRIMVPSEQVGFYSNWFGYWPWTAHNGEIESVTLWRVR